MTYQITPSLDIQKHRGEKLKEIGNSHFLNKIFRFKTFEKEQRKEKNLPRQVFYNSINLHPLEQAFML